MIESNFSRQWYLDWVRVWAFAILILYHVGMYYVEGWAFHIKSANTSVLLQDLMLLTNPWRMSLLFFISGIVFAYCERKMSTWTLFKAKFIRLFIPLIFSMYIVVAPQLYLEASGKGLIDMTFIEFWFSYINPNTVLLPEYQSIIGLLTWNHLWFLAYLWTYCVCLLLIFKLLPVHHFFHSCLTRLSPAFAFVLVVSFIFCVWFCLRAKYPSTHALIDDWYNHGKYFFVFFSGYCFALLPRFKASVIAHRHILLILALLGYSFIIMDKHGVLYGLAQLFDTSIWVKSLYGVILSINHWAWILMLIGYGARYLDKPSNKLAYATGAILPWYILHQTLIMIAAAWLKPYGISIIGEGILIVLFTVMGCYVGYEIIKRSGPVKILFGLPSLSN
ncbi:acyltransferase family protein [Pseudoalteromonas luteoviolacea]|uniref:acyltransferase family protein n=1 Tax=Pseudoalteromonas luteoviolacea TaxID=43657 RepID=UPI001EEF65CE|nr:acyltransferase family protein [Pseudoalteromonas luteoviolacea]MCF6437873.1 acyltransferase family protein [Pseudoalteromonas luteoviolacea]